jgi:hypothetical protein
VNSKEDLVELKEVELSDEKETKRKCELFYARQMHGGLFYSIHQVARA